MDPKEQLLRNTALRICLDWVNSPGYRRSASYETVRETSHLWQTIEHERKTSGTYHYEETQKFWVSALKYAIEKGWMEQRFSKIGRPRSNDYSANEMNRAEWLLNTMWLADSTAKRLKSVAGDWQQEAHSLITVSDRLFEALIEDSPLGHFDQISRDELEEVMGMSPRATNEFYRWLKNNGWGEKRLKFKNELGEVSRVRVIYREEV